MFSKDEKVLLSINGECGDSDLDVSCNYTDWVTASLRDYPVLLTVKENYVGSNNACIGLSRDDMVKIIDTFTDIIRYIDVVNDAKDVIFGEKKGDDK